MLTSIERLPVYLNSTFTLKNDNSYIFANALPPTSTIFEQNCTTTNVYQNTIFGHKFTTIVLQTTCTTAVQAQNTTSCIPNGVAYRNLRVLGAVSGIYKNTHQHYIPNYRHYIPNYCHGDPLAGQIHTRCLLCPQVGMRRWS